MPPILVFVAMLGAGLLIGGASVVALRSAGARPGMARRLAGPREVKVGTLLDAGALPERAVRVVGRIRCRDPLEIGGGERLVAFHRDVEVKVAASWRSIERLRETRSFELWDHDGSLTVDPAQASEPLVVIPKVWRGDPSVLEEPHASATARLVERHGAATEARATTRTINVTDRLMVVARPTSDVAGRVRLEPPQGGYLVTNLALDDAMRLLGGSSRRLAVAAVAGVAASIVLLAVGGVGMLLTGLLGA